MTARRTLLAIVAITACRAQPSSTIEATGSLELVEVDITPQVPSRVAKVWRQEGDRVKAGDTLLTLTQSTLPGDILAQQAGVAMAQAQLSDLIAGPRPAETATADANARAAEAEATKTAQDLARFTPLTAKGDISQQHVRRLSSASDEPAGRRQSVDRQSTRAVHRVHRSAARANRHHGKGSGRFGTARARCQAAHE